MFNNYSNYSSGLFNTLKTNPIYGQSTDLFRSTNFNDTRNSLFSSNNLFSSCPTCSGGSNYGGSYLSSPYKFY